jgi:hypothetical protein
LPPRFAPATPARFILRARLNRMLWSAACMAGSARAAGCRSRRLGGRPLRGPDALSPRLSTVLARPLPPRWMVIPLTSPWSVLGAAFCLVVSRRLHRHWPHHRRLLARWCCAGDRTGVCRPAVLVASAVFAFCAACVTLGVHLAFLPVRLVLRARPLPPCWATSARLCLLACSTRRFRLALLLGACALFASAGSP